MKSISLLLVFLFLLAAAKIEIEAAIVGHESGVVECLRQRLRIALKEIERVGKHAYLWVESYRNAREQFNLECWALTCWAFLTNEEWIYEFQTCGYTGDYEFIYFE